MSSATRVSSFLPTVHGDNIDATIGNRARNTRFPFSHHDSSKLLILSSDVSQNKFLLICSVGQLQNSQKWVSYFKWKNRNSKQQQRKCFFPQGPDFCVNKANGNYADPTNCHAFITCSNGFETKTSCGDLEYNEVEDRCDWPANVNCGTNGCCYSAIDWPAYVLAIGRRRAFSTTVGIGGLWLVEGAVLVDFVCDFAM